MKLGLILAVVATIFLSGCKEEKKAMILPVYFYDTALWQDVAKADGNIVAIVNPNNGPGYEVDSNYQKFIDNLVKNSKKPIGYIYSKWGNRDINKVKSDIDRWLELYPKIKGFFIDESATSKDRLNYYKELSSYIKSKGDYFIELNPGTKPDKEYYNISDNIVVFESSKDELNKDNCKENPDKSSIIVYNATKEEMENIIHKYNCKYYYVTDDTLSNPYDSLPSYFKDELRAINPNYIFYKNSNRY